MIKAEEPAEKRAQRIAAALLTTGLALLLAAAVLGLPEGQGLSGAVQGSLAQSGVANPVTAVLLNFRAYDTLLEVCVLLVALTGVLTLAGGTGAEPAQSQDPVLTGLTRVLVPLMALVSGYLLYEGAAAPGGAFQAGAVLGSAIVLSRLAGLAPHERHNKSFVAAAALGFAVFLFIAVMPMAAGRNFIEYPPGLSHTLIFVIESALTISIALILYLLFYGASAIPPRGSTGDEAR